MTEDEQKYPRRYVMGNGPANASFSEPVVKEVEKAMKYINERYGAQGKADVGDELGFDLPESDKFDPSSDILWVEKPKTPHYSGCGVEPIDLIISQNLGFLEGNIVKYVCRYGRKDGVADLVKARQYLTWLIEREENR